MDALAAVDKAELTDDDQPEYTEAALRASASRWAGEALASSTANGSDLGYSEFAG